MADTDEAQLYCNILQNIYVNRRRRRRRKRSSSKGRKRRKKREETRDTRQARKKRKKKILPFLQKVNSVLHPDHCKSFILCSNERLKSPPPIIPKRRRCLSLFFSLFRKGAARPRRRTRGFTSRHFSFTATRQVPEIRSLVDALFLFRSYLM